MTVTKTAVIIAAAGSPRRMGSGLPKQYRMCEDLPVLVKTVKAFCACGDNFEIFLTVPPGDENYVRELLDRYGVPPCTILAGGDERPNSVYKALCQVTAPRVLVHDGARPFVTPEVIHRVADALETHAAVIPCVSPKNTIRTKTETLDRSTLYEVQTPQGFHTAVLKEAYEKAFADGFVCTDEAGVTEHMGISTFIVEGAYENKKLTTPEDFPKTMRCGIGYDVHKLVSGRPLMLGCVQVPYDLGLLGHSDADVIAHAIADALLGAAAQGDIGKHFPDKDPQYEGMSGRRILSETAEILRKNGFTINNVDATLVAERPKVSKYTQAMEMAVAEALGIDHTQVGIKATTEEGLGISGKGDAMAAYATVSIQ